MKNLNNVIIYTDGSCLGNPGPGGCSSIIKLLYDNEIKEHVINKGYRNTTNNRMEMLAAIQALNFLCKNNLLEVSINIYTDSKYLMDGITKWINKWKLCNWINSYKRTIKNKDLWQIIYELQKRFLKIDWYWVKGHSGHIENERCNLMAQNAAKNSILLDDVGYI